jgi:hypothetical protein
MIRRRGIKPKEWFEGPAIMPYATSRTLKADPKISKTNLK